MGETREKYKALLKPVQDSLLKDWNLTLVLYLDDFLSHTDDETKVNFSEAAMVLQNSVTFYCKRIDVVYKIMQELVTEMITMKTTEANGEEAERGAVKGAPKKKKVKSLENEELEVLGFADSSVTIDANIDKIIVCELKKISVCIDMKTLKKAGTSVTVYQSNGMALGCKEEFRLFTKLFSDGTVNSDLNFDTEKIMDFADESMEEDMDLDRGDDFQNSFSAMGDGLEPDAVHEDVNDQVPEPTLGVPDITACPVSPNLPMEFREFAAPAKTKPKKLAEWDVVPFEYKFILKPMKIKECRSIPVALLENEESTVKLSSKRKRVHKVEDIFKINWIDQAIRRGSVNAYTRRIEIEKEKRKSLISSKPQAAACVEEDEAMGDVDTHEPADDFEDCLDDNALLPTVPVSDPNDFMDDDAPGDYHNEALKAIADFKEARRINSATATAVAKRVAEWHEAIAPILEAAEQRSQFNVHEYGTRILEKFPDDDTTTLRPFKDVITDQPKKEICKYFLSTLMLANTYNLEISKSTSEPLVKDCVQLRLLTKMRHHEEMDEALRQAAEEGS